MSIWVVPVVAKSVCYLAHYLNQMSDSPEFFPLVIRWKTPLCLRSGKNHLEINVKNDSNLMF